MADFYSDDFEIEKEIGRVMFKPGQRLKITDKSGHPTDPKEREIVVIDLLEVGKQMGPEYLVHDPQGYQDACPFGTPNPFNLTRWWLDLAIREDRISVEVIGEHEELKFA